MKCRRILRGIVTGSLFLASIEIGFSQTLNVTNGLQLWLRADAGVSVGLGEAVSQWEDQSGNGNHATQATPAQAPTRVNNALNGRPVIHFDGADDFLDVADSDSISITGDITSFFVVRFDDFATFRAVWGKTAANLPGPTDIYALPNSGVLRVFRGDGTFNNLSSVDTAQALRANAFLVLGFAVENSTLSHFLNSQTNGVGPVTVNTADAGTPLKIGTRDDLVTRLQGDLAELLIYDRALTVAERNNVFNYLQTKYNLLNLPPSVSLATAPSGPSVNVGSLLTLTATANDLDGTISRVQFFANGVSLATATAPPYSVRIYVDSAGPLQLTARATDNGDATSESAPLNLIAGPAGPTDLNVTSGLQLWLTADAGVSEGLDGGVVEWADQSGNANHASQPIESMAPVRVNAVVNGRPVLRFDGTDDFMDVADADSLSITGDITSLFVLRFDDFATFRAVWAKTSGNLPAPTDFYTLPSSGVPRVFRGNGSGTGIQLVDGARPFPAGSVILAGFDMAGTTLTHHLNGQPNGSGAITVPLVDADRPLKIGSRDDFVTRFKGDLAELVIYDRALSATERRSAQRYLAEKYGLPGLVTPSNAMPSVAIIGPLGQIVEAPGNLTITASASDPDGAVTAVEFFADGRPLGSDSSAPYTASLNLSYGGSVTIMGVATDNLGARQPSTAVPVCVQGPASPAGLVGYWPLDGNGTATIGVNGNLVNSPAPTSDRNDVAGGALAFDGSQLQRVEVPGGGGFNGARQGSISLWVKWSGTQDGGFGGSFGAVLGRQANGVFSDNIINLSGDDPNGAILQWRQNLAAPATITGSGLVGNETWRHIAVTFTETSSELFLDGFSEGTGLGGVLHNNANIPLAIGAWIGDGASYSSASIDDVAIWDRVLSADEVQQLALQDRSPLNLLLKPDCLSIQRVGPNVVVRWLSATQLQRASDVNGPWSDVLNATSPFSAPVAEAPRFFRLRSP